MVQLKYLQDVIDLEIKGLEDLGIGKKQQKYFKTAEQRVKIKYHAPSLSAYLIYEHQFNEKTVKQLASELKVDDSRLWSFMKLSGIPTRNRAESWNTKRANFSGRVINKLKEKADENKMSIRDYLIGEYSKLPYISDLAKDLGTNRQTVYNIMKELGIIPIGNPWRRSLETKVEQKFGISLDEYLKREYLEKFRDVKNIAEDLDIYPSTIYYIFKGQGVKLRPRIYLKGERSHFYGKHHTEESKRKISEGKSGKNHPLYGKTYNQVYGEKKANKIKRKMSRAKKKTVIKK